MRDGRCHDCDLLLDLSIPATVPFTMQTFAVCLVTALFGLRLGLWTVTGYILLGMAGGSGFRGLLQAASGSCRDTTGGYIIGFLFTAGRRGCGEAFPGRKVRF